MCDFNEVEYLNCMPQSAHMYGLSPVCTLMCIWRLLAVLNPLSQMLQRHGISSLCSASIWRLSMVFVLKLFWQVWHGYGRSDVWTCECFCRSHARRNVIGQLSHWWGLCPVWMLMCRCTQDGCLKRRPQTAHIYGFSSQWVRSWKQRVPCCVKRLLHPATRQGNGRSPVWIITWFFSVCSDLTTRPQSLHTNGFFSLLVVERFLLAIVIRWVAMCLFSADIFLNDILHMEQYSEQFCLSRFRLAFINGVDISSPYEDEVCPAIFRRGGTFPSSATHSKVLLLIKQCFFRLISWYFLTVSARWLLTSLDLLLQTIHPH